MRVRFQSARARAGATGSSRLPAGPRRFVHTAHQRSCRSAAAPGVYAASSTEEEEDVDFCAPAFVTPEDTPTDTKLTLRVLDYSGLLHVVSWVLKGMEVRVKSAYMTVDDEGIAEDVFHITTLSGNKLSDARVRDIVERVRSFVMFCQPSGRKVPVEWRNGPVLVSNKADGDMTLMTVVEARKRAGFLLEIISVMSGVGVKIHDVEVHTCSECSDDPTFQSMMAEAALQGGIKDGRVIRLRLGEVDGGKLTQRSIDSAMFSMSLFLGKGRTETIVPSSSSYATAWERVPDNDDNGAA